jgi:hypothetical protein
VEDKQNGLRDVPTILHVISFRRDTPPQKKDVKKSKRSTFDEPDQQIGGLFVDDPFSTSEGNVLESTSSRLQNCVQNTGAHEDT